MQQTETYKFNLIEPSDTFSPDPLNENMEKVEAQLDAARAEAAAGDEALEQRITVLEGHKIVMGAFDGDGKTILEFMVGGTPKLVIVKVDGGSSVMALLDSPLDTGKISNKLYIVDGGFQVYGTLNMANTSYHYLALI